MWKSIFRWSLTTSFRYKLNHDLYQISSRWNLIWILFLFSEKVSKMQLSSSWWATRCKWVLHDDGIKWKHFPRYWPFVRGIHQPPVNSPHKGQWRGALMFSLICAWINGWINNGEAGDLRRHRAHYDVTVIDLKKTCMNHTEVAPSGS